MGHQGPGSCPSKGEAGERGGEHNGVDGRLRDLQTGIWTKCEWWALTYTSEI